MLIDFALTAAYEVVRYSWITSTIATPAFLALISIQTYGEGSIEFGEFLDNIEQEAPQFVGSVFLIGAVLAGFQPEIEPILKNLTQPLAFALFAFLFYRF